MFEALFIIGMSAIAFILGRSVRDLFKKRPVRDKKTRRKGLHKLFAFIALLVVILLIVTISIILGVIVFYEEIALAEFLVYLAIDGFSAYIFIILIQYLKKN